MRQRRIFWDTESVYQSYHDLQRGDLICCRLRLRPGEEHLLLDLAERGIEAVPSLRAQWLSRSKAFQVRLFSWAMPPDTTVIYTIHDLVDAINRYEKNGRKQVVVKLEGKNGGLGVLLFPSIEAVYTQSVLGSLTYPFVLQPFVAEATDLRVVILGDYLEAYRRTNPHSFRNNLHCGGVATPCLLREEQRALCRKIMEQGGFPYAHLDLLEIDERTTCFLEINLRGGLRGAGIDSKTYQQRVAAIHRRLAEHHH